MMPRTRPLRGRRLLYMYVSIKRSLEAGLFSFFTSPCVISYPIITREEHLQQNLVKPSELQHSLCPHADITTTYLLVYRTCFGPYLSRPLDHSSSTTQQPSPIVDMLYATSKKPYASSPKIRSSSSSSRDSYHNSSRSHSQSGDSYYTSHDLSEKRKSSKLAPKLVHYSPTDLKSKTLDPPRTKYQDPKYSR